MDKIEASGYAGAIIKAILDAYSAQTDEEKAEFEPWSNLDWITEEIEKAMQQARMEERRDIEELVDSTLSPEGDTDDRFNAAVEMIAGKIRERYDEETET